MKEIELSTWKRREHFEFFRRVDLPFYNMNVSVDIRDIREIAKQNSLSFSTVMMYVTMKAMNRVDNFRYRLRGERVVLHETLHPFFAHIKDGDELFGMTAVSFSDDLGAFAKRVQDAIEEMTCYFDMTKLQGRDDFVFISPIPWIAFTATDHTLSLRKEDAIPRVTWGKFHMSGGNAVLPYNVQVNHMFVDGIHVGRFFESLEDELSDLRRRFSTGVG